VRNDLDERDDPDGERQRTEPESDKARHHAPPTLTAQRPLAYPLAASIEAVPHRCSGVLANAATACRA
jgi:hypothetical protein